MKGNGITKGVSSGIGAIVNIQTSLNKNWLVGLYVISFQVVHSFCMSLQSVLYVYMQNNYMTSHRLHIISFTYNFL